MATAIDTDETARFPIGRFILRDEPLTHDQRVAAIDSIAALPAKLRAAVTGLTERQLDTPYREGGWRVRQVIHHVSDSHMNGFIRTKLGVTEERPVIKPYDQDRWSELADARETPIDVSLKLLEAVHTRWVIVARSLAPSDFDRRIFHPEMGEMTIDQLIAQYAWHGEHHLAHITRVIDD